MLPDLRDPSLIAALLFFDRAARLQSFAAAAAELHVTPSAVSHRIAALETALGKQLFSRHTRRVQLTPEGAELAHATMQAFKDIKEAIDNLAASKILRVSVGPYISAHWLMARLTKFEADLPFLRVELTHTMGSASTRTTDVAIMWTNPDEAELSGRLLFDCHYVPVMAPALKPDRQFWETTVLPIHFQDRTQWRHWLKSTGTPLSFAERGEVLNDPNLVFEAAVHGRGVAIGMLPFISGLMEQGRLTAAHPAVVPAEKNYWVFLADQNNPNSRKFQDWLAAEAAATKSLSSIAY